MINAVTGRYAPSVRRSSNTPHWMPWFFWCCCHKNGKKTITNYVRWRTVWICSLRSSQHEYAALYCIGCCDSFGVVTMTTKQRKDKRYQRWCGVWRQYGWFRTENQRTSFLVVVQDEVVKASQCENSIEGDPVAVGNSRNAWKTIRRKRRRSQYRRRQCLTHHAEPSRRLATELESRNMAAKVFIHRDQLLPNSCRIQVGNNLGGAKLLLLARLLLLLKLSNNEHSYTAYPPYRKKW